jgi:lysyl-tRNA synthetase class 2
MRHDNLRKRSQIVRRIRDFFLDQDFVEISTPILVPNPGLEPFLKHFETFFEGGEMSVRSTKKFYLPTSPEYHLKKALGKFQYSRVFEIAKTFRNGETSPEHEPEFTMLEWYRSPGTYRDIARDFEDLLEKLGTEFALSHLWGKAEHITVTEAFLKYANIDLVKAMDGEKKQNNEPFETFFQRIIVEKIEPHLGHQGPTFLWDYPSEFAALSRKKASDKRFCERFEVYWQGIELANAFGELTDPTEQRLRCLEDIETRKGLYGHSPELDEEFINSLEKLPSEVGGIAVGVDRLVQCLLGAKSVQEVIAFPIQI